MKKSHLESERVKIQESKATSRTRIETRTKEISTTARWRVQACSREKSNSCNGKTRKIVNYTCC